MNINVNGEFFEVLVSYDGQEVTNTQDSSAKDTSSSTTEVKGEPVASPLEGRFYFTKDASETPIKEGDTVKKGDVVGYIEAMKTYNAIRLDRGGVVAKILKENGSEVEEDDELIVLK
jgi:pyruvate carboxylase subunit B